MSAEGEISSRLWRAMFFCILLVLIVGWLLQGSSAPLIPVTSGERSSPSPEMGPITVKITNSEIRTAIARVLETYETDSLDQEKLIFSACLQGQNISVVAPGYYIEKLICTGASPHEYSVLLRPLNASDNLNYAWIDADARSSSTLHCERCHKNPVSGLNEYAEWGMGGHAASFVNPYFQTTYTGSNINGTPGEKTIWNFSQNGQRIRLPHNPVSAVPDYGPGYQLDYPEESGNCAFCHAPAALGATQHGVNLSPLMYGAWGYRANVASEGVTCDVCHKVTGVILDENRLPYAERPGVLSFSLLRPDSSPQIFTGPGAYIENSITDVNHTCAAVFSESEFCAPCHYGTFSGVEIYGSYKEWLDSPYNIEGPNYRSCQDCHMYSSAPIGSSDAAGRSACSEFNQKYRDFSHNMMKYGPEDPNNPFSRVIPWMVKEAATVTIEEIMLADGQVKFTVKVVNTGAGHKFPTDSPLRHLILWIDVKDGNGNSLMQVSGPIISRVGNLELAGYPGEIYANMLKDKDTNVVPTIAYWNPVEPAWQNADTRLVPHVPRLSEYSFTTPSNGYITITARLIYRNAFSDIANKKQMIPTEIEAAANTAIVPITP
jgi:hypothetical protein